MTRRFTAPISDNSDGFFDEFVEQFTVDELYHEAEKYLRQIDGSLMSFDHCKNGLMGHVIAILLDIEHGLSLVPRLMVHYDLTKKSLPPRMVLQELMKAEVHRERLAERLFESLRCEQSDGQRASLDMNLARLTADSLVPSDTINVQDGSLNDVIRGILSREQAMTTFGLD